MNIVSGTGVVLTAGGAVAYLVGVGLSFPGRAFSVTAVMVGITLRAVGRPRGGHGVISALVYADQEVVAYDDLGEARQAVGTTWVHVAEASEAEIATVQSALDRHPLAVEDMRDDVRAKTGEFQGYSFVLLKGISLTPGETTLQKEAAAKLVGIFICRDWVVTLGTGPPGRYSA